MQFKQYYTHISIGFFFFRMHAAIKLGYEIQKNPSESITCSTASNTAHSETGWGVGDFRSAVITHIRTFNKHLGWFLCDSFNACLYGLFAIALCFCLFWPPFNYHHYYQVSHPDVEHIICNSIFTTAFLVMQKLSMKFTRRLLQRNKFG